MASMATIAEAAGADACTVINTAPGMIMNSMTGKPLLGSETGGLSGPAIKPMALAAVWEISHRSSVPIIGVGGITNLQDVLDFLHAGACAVQIGTASFYDPMTMFHLIQELDIYLTQEQCTVRDLIGCVHTKQSVSPERTDI